MQWFLLIYTISPTGNILDGHFCIRLSIFRSCSSLLSCLALWHIHELLFASILPVMVLIGLPHARYAFSCQPRKSIVELNFEHVGKSFLSLRFVERLKIDFLALTYWDLDPILTMKVSRAPKSSWVQATFNQKSG